MKFKQFLLGIMLLCCLLLTACGRENPTSSKIKIVTSTNVYADIARNIVGKYGTSTAIIKDSSTDPHDFEPTTFDAKEMSTANIVVANGLGYDGWFNKLSSAVDKDPVLVGEDLMALKQGANPHIWYNLTMPQKYVAYLVKRLSRIEPQHAAYFKHNGQKYLAQFAKIRQIVSQKQNKPKKPVFVSEPVFDYALKEAGYQIADKGFEEAVEKETDPSPQIIHQMNQQIKDRKIAFFVNNVQASSTTVNSFVRLAQQHHIPILNVRETIPNHVSYLAWMRSNYQKLAAIDK